MNLIKDLMIIVNEERLHERESVDTKDMVKGLKKLGMKHVSTENSGEYVHFEFKGNDFSVKMSSNMLFVTGYKDSLEVESNVVSAEEVYDAAKNIDNKWMKENDPHFEHY